MRTSKLNRRLWWVVFSLVQWRGKNVRVVALQKECQKGFSGIKLGTFIGTQVENNVQ